MSARRVAVTTVIVAIGGAVVAGLFWALLNVPESNVLALTLSALIALLAVVAVGATVAAAVAAADDASAGDGLRRSLTALPAFVLGLAITGALWWLTGAAGDWWLAHRGETDALLIRYGNITHTRPLHSSVAAVLWLGRWVIGVSMVAALVTAAAVRPAAGLRRGLRNGVALVPLAVTLAIAELFTRAWPMVYWRPKRVAAWMEPTFVGVKLAVLYLVAALIVAAGIVVMRRVAVARRAT